MAKVGPYTLSDATGGELANVLGAVSPGGEAVALELPCGSATAQDGDLARFEREVRIAASIEHPHLCRVIDHGVDEVRGPWLATQPVHGMTLRDFSHDKTLGPEAAIAILAPMIDALAALHARGVVHRRVSPENLVLSPVGDVTLIGLAPGLPSDVQDAVRSPYLAPEQLDGRDVDPTADVWAAGVMLYELVTGERPFDDAGAGEPNDAIARATFAPLADADRRVGRDLDWLVGVCLAADPWKRPKDAMALLERVRPMQWGALERARETRVSVLSDPKGFEKRIAPKVAAALREQAVSSLSVHDERGAMRLLDRALAYAPEDEATHALVARVTSGLDEPAPVARGRAPPVPRRRVRIASLVGLATFGAVGLAAVVWITDGSSVRVDPPLIAEERDHDAGADADAAARIDGRLSFRPIPPDLLRNDDRADLDGVAAAPEEPLVDPSALGREPEVALREAVGALRDDPDDLSASRQQVMSLLALGRNRAGLAALEELEHRHGDDPSALALLGVVAMRRGRFDRADALFTSAIEREPRHVDALRRRGVLRRRSGRTRDAYEDLVRVLAIDPDDLVALAEMTEIFRREGRDADAVPFLRRILTNRPTDVDAWTSLSLALSGSSDPAQIEEAVVAIERAIELSPDHVGAHRQRCTLLSRRAGAGVIAACSEAIRRAPDDPDLFMARALELSREHRHVPALADADRAIELAPENAELYVGRATLRERSGDETGALADHRVACQLGQGLSCARAGIDPPL